MPSGGDSEGDVPDEDGGPNEDGTPRQIYDKLAALEQSGAEIQWHHRVWNFLPFGTAWTLLAMFARETFRCRVEHLNFGRRGSPFQRAWFAVVRALQLILNGLALYVAIVACGATYQRKVAIRKLPYPKKTLYGPTMNEGLVCAFNEKCGSIQTFPSKEDANSANYTIAHCGPCGDCSNWNDMALQPMDLATPAQSCGQQNFFGGTSAIQACVERDIGFTPDCALAWAENIECSRQHCAFIYLQSLMTNHVGNFRVGNDTITSATCSEASCEAGNPGNFVAKVGANRRRMNIESEIARPGDQQCAIVGIAEDSEGYSDWNSFMNPPC